MNTDKKETGITIENGRCIVHRKEFGKTFITLTNKIVKDISKYEKKEIDELLKLKLFMLETYKKIKFN